MGHTLPVIQSYYHFKSINFFNRLITSASTLIMHGKGLMMNDKHVFHYYYTTDITMQYKLIIFHELLLLHHLLHSYEKFTNDAW